MPMNQTVLPTWSVFIAVQEHAKFQLAMNSSIVSKNHIGDDVLLVIL